VISKRSRLAPKANSKVMLDASNKAILVVDRGAMLDTSGKVALVIGGRAVLIASNRAVLIKNELLAAGDKAELGPEEDERPIALKRPTTTTRATMPIN